MDYYTIFLTLGRSVMLMPKFLVVDWIEESGNIIKMDMQTFTIRSFGEQLFQEGADKIELYKALDRLCAPNEDYPTGEPFSVIFH